MVYKNIKYNRKPELKPIGKKVFTVFIVEETQFHPV